MGYTPKHAKPATTDAAAKPTHGLLSLTVPSTGRHANGTVRHAPTAPLTPSPTPTVV